MIAARLSDGTLILGLSKLNMERLPSALIKIDGKSHPGMLPADIPEILIFTGSTEEAMAANLRAAMDRGTPLKAAGDEQPGKLKGIVPTNMVRNPWIVVNQPIDHSPQLDVTLMSAHARFDHYAVAIADIVRTVGNRFGRKPLAVMNRIRSELDRPTRRVMVDGTETH